MRLHTVMALVEHGLCDMGTAIDRCLCKAAGSVPNLACKLAKGSLLTFRLRHQCAQERTGCKTDCTQQYRALGEGCNQVTPCLPGSPAARLPCATAPPARCAASPTLCPTLEAKEPTEPAVAPA